MMNKVVNIITSFMFVGCIITFGLISLISKDKQTSDVENRNLAQRPDLNTATVISGQYFKDYETYFSDQLFKRDYLIKSFTMLQLKMNKTVINDTVIGKQGWLMEMPTTSNKKSNLAKSIKQMNALANFSERNNVSFYLALAPHKKNILSDHYPSYLEKNQGAENRDYFVKQLDPNIKYIDLPSYFKSSFNKDEIDEMYFKTDHHWNTKGAYHAYQFMLYEMRDILQKDRPKAITEYDVKCNDKSNFVGSYNRKLFDLIAADSEYVCSYIPADQSKLQNFKATPSKGAVVNDFFQVFGSGMQKRKITYAGISSKDYAEIILEYKNPSNENLLVLKDSYANPIVPFLAQHFHRTYVLDLRHYKEMNVYQYIKENNIDSVLILYNDANIFGNMYSFE